MISRDEVKNNAMRESAKADMKQHADKLIQGFEAADITHPKRAIWELIQNARDLSTECDIIIVLDNEALRFSHNGKPFTSNTLLSLIKQVSSKSSDKLHKTEVIANEVKEVGQYGTGFITTHAFGKKIILEGSLQLDNNSFVDLKLFEIDRRVNNSDELVDKLLDQQDAVFSLIENGEITATSKNTTFSYLFNDDTDFKNACRALEEYTMHYIPIVMTLNGRINSITIDNRINSSVINYKKGSREMLDDGIYKTSIFKDDFCIDLYSIRDETNELEIILPLSSINQTLDWGNYTGKLFLYFPLIGTENWGVNFIIHSGRFSPTEKRDGLHLNSSNTQTREKELNNQSIIEKASEMIFQFIDKHALNLKDPINITKIAFKIISNNEMLDEYYKKLKAIWVSKFKNYELVETNTGRIAPVDCLFLSPTFFQSEEYFESIYEIVIRFWENVPSKSTMKQWSEIIDTWQDNFTIITIDNIAEKIQQEETLTKFDLESLKQFYSFVYKSNNSRVFDEYRLLPNVRSKFVKKSSLHTAKSINKVFIEVADVIIPEVPSGFIDSTFILNADYSDYSRKQLSKDLNDQLSQLNKSLSSTNLLSDAVRDGLIKLCKTYPSVDNKGIRGEIMQFIEEYYEVSFDEIQIPNIEDEKIDYYSPLRCIIRHTWFDFLGKSSRDPLWVEKNLRLIENFLGLISDHKEFEEIVKSQPIFLNQKNEFKTQDYLLIEESIPDSLKILYDDILNFDIKDKLASDLCSKYLPHNNKRTGNELSNEVNVFLEKQGTYDNINEHPFKGKILDIINKITNSPDVWGRLFPAIFERRAIIMMARITKEEMKEDMFSILGLEDRDKISLLGDLARDKDMIQIIELGKERLVEINNKEADFQFKHSIGVHIEQMIHSKITDDLLKQSISVAVNSEQGGQDIIIRKDGEPIYYIEVKSRWSVQSSVMMSTDQMKKAVTNKLKYSLCCVDMCDYHPDSGNRNYPEDITLIMDRINVLMAIGGEIEPLISNALNSDLKEDTVRLTGDYRAVVPQVLIEKKGISFEKFLTELHTILQ